MYTLIKIEYLAANMLLELYEKAGKRTVSLEAIKDYGIKIKEELSKRNTSCRIIFLYSKEYANQFINDYSDLFVISEDCILLRDGVCPNDIRKRILAFAPVDLLRAMISSECLSFCS